MKKHYIRQQDNLLYEKLLYTGEFHQPSNFTFVVYDKKTVSHDSFDDVTELSSFIDKPGVKWLAVEGLADTERLDVLFQMLDIDRLWMQDIVNARHIAKIDLLDDDVIVVMDYCLTILSAIFIPLTFMAGVWGMNFKYMPELDYQWGYLIAMSSMLLIAVIVVIYFRIKKWL